MRNAAHLFLVVAMFTTGGAMAGEFDCAACGDECQANWVCVPQCTTQFIEVTEWGVQTERICPPRAQWCCFGWGQRAGAGCDDSCDAGCDGGCEACGPALPGIGPRVRKKLMRKTLVYSVSALQSVPQLAGPDCTGCTECGASDGDCARLQIDFARRVTPAESLAAAGSSASVRWLNVSDAPVTMLLASSTDVPPVAVVAEQETTPIPTKIHWIDGHRVEHVESLGTMSETADIQPPAPITTQREAVDTATLPLISQPILIQR